MDILKKSFPLWLLGAMQVGKLYASDSQTAVQISYSLWPTILDGMTWA